MKAKKSYFTTGRAPIYVYDMRDVWNLCRQGAVATDLRDNVISGIMVFSLPIRDCIGVKGMRALVEDFGMDIYKCK